MYQELIKTLINSLDSVLSISFGRNNFAGVSSEILYILFESGILAHSGHAQDFECPNCGDSHEVGSRQGRNGTTQSYMQCPAVGRLLITDEDLVLYKPSHMGLAGFLARDLCPSSTVVEAIPERLWSLGRRRFASRQIDAYLARGAGWPDAHERFTAIRLDGSVTITLCPIPRNCFPASTIVLPLCALLSLTDAGMSLDVAEIERQVSAGSFSAVSPSTTECLFTKQGDFWSVSYAGKRAILKHSKGLTYIAMLLENPNVEFEAIELAIRASTDGLDPTTLEHLDGAELLEGGFQPGLGSSAPQALADADYRREVKDQIAKLQTEISRARSVSDSQKVTALTARMNDLIRIEKQITGFAGALRTFATDPQKSEAAISRAIRRAINNIASTKGLALLGDHLGSFIATSVKFSYRPAEPTKWIV